MSRRHDSEKLEEIYDVIEKNPGWIPAWIARKLGRHRSDIIRTLPALEEHGLLVSEDEHGRLFPFARREDSERP